MLSVYCLEFCHRLVSPGCWDRKPGAVGYKGQTCLSGSSRLDLKVKVPARSGAGEDTLPSCALPVRLL